jgi:hypothetical protein
MSILNLLLVAAAGFQANSSLDQDLEVALGTASLNTRTARFDQNLLRFFGGARYSSPFFQATFENPWRLPFFSESVRRELSGTQGLASDTVQAGARLMGYGTRRTLLGNPNLSQEVASERAGALQAVLERLQQENVLRGEIPGLNQVPSEVQHAAALVLNTMLKSVEMRRLAFARLEGVEPAYQFIAQHGHRAPEGQPFERYMQIAEAVDLNYLTAGGHDLLLACQKAAQLVAAVPETVAYDFTAETVWGQIRLSGGGQNTYGERPILLVIDTGGNDTYVNVPSNAGSANWASVVIDTSGNDRYLSDAALAGTSIPDFAERRRGEARPGPGGALFGYAVLIDLSGDDLYRSHRTGIGSGRFGIGVVQDHRGNDVYDAYMDGQGFGHFGIGLLEDIDGDDRYEGFNHVQGVGQTMGFGLLVDRRGDDRYIANNTVIDFPSAQSQDQNVSMAQGAGNGRRADYLEGHSLAGGVGILFDQAGNDGYSCGVFGQGVGYWEGVGMLWDSAGSDIYIGSWYVQGAAAHFAVGYLEDEQGNDSYTAHLNMAQGAGHDFSIGFLLDRQGDDKYRAPNLSLGAGNANGFGVFVDMMGNDTYESSGLTLGRAAEPATSGLRSRALTLGVFMDLSGRDTYPAGVDYARDVAKLANWAVRGITPPESHVGIFWDR